MTKIIKGILVGLGKIIPGVSGSILALSLGIYEESISAINNFFIYPKNSFKYLFPIGIGILISIVFFSKIIIIMLSKYYISSILFFLGLIIGGTKDIVNKIKIKYLPVTLICAILLLSLEFIPKFKNLSFNKYSFKFYYYFIIGIVDAITMVIPGISGTAVLMILGCYGTLITIISDIFNINNIYVNFSVLLPFIIGLVFGTVILTKIVDKLFQKYFCITYNAIFGFLCATVLYMFKTTLNSNYNMIQVLLGIIFFVIGYHIAKRIN